VKTPDDFRFNAHRHLIDLDATTNHLMLLVVAGNTSGATWGEAVSRQQVAFEAWAGFLASSQQDPFRVFDGRPPSETLPTSD
jgi:hypothetical protein